MSNMKRTVDESEEWQVWTGKLEKGQLWRGYSENNDSGNGTSNKYLKKRDNWKKTFWKENI